MRNTMRPEEEQGGYVLLSNAPLGTGFAGMCTGTREGLQLVAEFLLSVGFATEAVVVSQAELEAVR